jgi:hypothetical protein
MQLDQGVFSPPREPIGKTSQGSCGGVTRQTGQVMKHAVLAHRLDRFDPSQTQHQRIEESLQGVADAVAVVALGKSNVPRQGMTQSNT